MQKFRDLTEKWQSDTKPVLTSHTYEVRLPIQDAARLEALSALYPNANQEEIITDLLHAALDEVESAFPYVEGEKVMAKDEWGNPVYEDIGPSPTYRKLKKEQLKKLQSSSSTSS